MRFQRLGLVALARLDTKIRLSRVRAKRKFRMDHKLSEVKQAKMVGWYDPTELVRTAIEVIVSTLFARHSDSRRLDAVASADAQIDFVTKELLEENGDFWFDYVADCGDGWDSTYAVAYSISKPFLHFDGLGKLCRGRVLVFGGDLVYPIPTKDNYDIRLVGPYRIASEFYHDDPAQVVAIPGNHDWYDSLVAFRRLFFQRGAIGFRRPRQMRSYFVAKLPQRWWLFAVDLQLDHDLDDAQYRFFSGACEQLSPDDRVVLCLAEPIWIAKKRRTDTAHWGAQTLIDRLLEELGSKVVISIAGDLHHYRRHSDKDGKHLITCGTGGAFLHPTHELDSDTLGKFNLQTSFPSKKTSFWLTFLNLAFIIRNPKFGIVAATSYLLAAWQNAINVGEQFSEVKLQEMGRLGLAQWKDAVIAGVHSAILSPIGLALYAIIVWGFVFFADKRSAAFRVIGGTLHAMIHIAAGFSIYWFAVYVTISMCGLPAKSIPQYLLTATIIVPLSWILGSVILGTYLLVSLNVFKKHSNAAFSALRIKDWKGFLRGRIRADGGLELTFVGLRKVPRRWNVGTTPTGRSVLVPDPESSLVPTVEDRVVVEPSPRRCP
jgi:Calcineurin-like phosphoesterase